MTPDDVHTAVQEIRDYSYLESWAHYLEDELYERVLSEISKGAPNAVELAKAALETRFIMFNRWSQEQ